MPRPRPAYRHLSAQQRRRFIANRNRSIRAVVQDQNEENNNTSEDSSADSVIVQALRPNSDIEQSARSSSDDDDTVVDDAEPNVLGDNRLSDVESDNGGVGNDVVVDLEYNSRKALRAAFNAARLKQAQQKIMLQTLRSFPFNLRYLPKDPRTVMQTPTIVVRDIIQQVSGGEYLHFGLENLLEEKLLSIRENSVPDRILIDISIDGMQLYKVGNVQFWPIQFRVLNIGDRRPLVAGIFQGDSKPGSVFQYFDQFVTEARNILDRGWLSIRNRLLPLRIRCFIADAPARAFGLNHVGHMGANACSKCKVVGRRCTVEGFRGTMVFLGINHHKRTDNEYENLLDEDHHKGPSPLSSLIGLVSKTPFEPMHLLYQGIIKKILDGYMKGKFGCRRLSRRQIEILDARLNLLKDYCLSEFNRRPFPISKYDKMKATQFRQLLLFTLSAVFRDVIDNQSYLHMTQLHSICRLLSFENQPEPMLNHCQRAIEMFVQNCTELYGEQFMSYNVHALLHIVDDVRELGKLESFSAFGYENSLAEIRRLATAMPNKPLEQYHNRIKEYNRVIAESVDEIKFIPSRLHFEGPLIENIGADMCQQYKVLKIGPCTLSTYLRDSCFRLKNSDICIIRNIIFHNGDYWLIVSCFRETASLYNVGHESTECGVFVCRRLPQRFIPISMQQIDKKCYIMPRWSSREGLEEVAVDNEYICATFISSIQLPVV